jgi:hypothetical protein
MKSLRGVEMPALQSALAVLGSIDFADSATLVPTLQAQVQKLTTLQAETWEALAKPKAERREAAGKEYNDTALALLATLDTLSAKLFASIEHDDAFIDQMMGPSRPHWSRASCRPRITGATPAMSAAARRPGARSRRWRPARRCRSR